ncbi:MAG: hypothetical protein ABJI60_12490 [Kangiellaceae bacterium]|jgi:hypothetical protein
MKLGLKLLGLILILASKTAYVEAGPGMNYKCTYKHTVTETNSGAFVSSHLTLSDEVFHPSLCPPVPADEEFTVENTETHINKSNTTPHFTKTIDDSYDDLTCSHSANPPIYTPIR